MRRFSKLFESLDTTTSTLAKIDAMRAYFETAEPADAAWAVYVMIGRRARRIVGPALLRRWLLEEAHLPEWLIDETYASVGDLAETIALLVPNDLGDSGADLSLNDWFTLRIQPLARQDETEKRRLIVGWWHRLPYRECFLVNKLLTGSLRVGVSRSLVTRALAESLGQPRAQIERSLIGDWQPGAEFWGQLIRNEANLHVAHPYPFYLASPLEGEPEGLGERAAWLAEWKWDGIRGQIVRRGDRCVLWSRGEEIITDRFPEVVDAAAGLPDGTVLDGEILAGSGEHVLPFSQLQQRTGRRKLSPKILKENPAQFIAYDLLEFGGQDWRARPLRERRGRLERLLDTRARVLRLSPVASAGSWEELAVARNLARAKGVEGLMLKSWTSPYGAGRQRGAWWKWKVNPFVVDAVLLYAAPGHGRRSNLYTDYTFGVWCDAELIPIAKAYSGLTDEEIRRLDAWIRRHTKEKFGTVRSVEPTHLFELAFEGIASSSRHKSGVALRFPRILRWRTDKPVAEANTLADLRQLLTEQHSHAAQ
ncbi:MAG TPA: ATP-dependent DNA ligase [Steroidobacteraceae bacterium]